MTIIEKLRKDIRELTRYTESKRGGLIVSVPVEGLVNTQYISLRHVLAILEAAEQEPHTDVNEARLNSMRLPPENHCLCDGCGKTIDVYRGDRYGYEGKKYCSHCYSSLRGVVGVVCKFPQTTEECEAWLRERDIEYRLGKRGEYHQDEYKVCFYEIIFNIDGLWQSQRHISKLTGHISKLTALRMAVAAVKAAERGDS